MIFESLNVLDVLVGSRSRSAKSHTLLLNTLRHDLVSDIQPATSDWTRPMELFAAHPEQMDMSVLWPHINHFINQAAERSHGEITPETLKASVERGDTQLWVILDQEREGPERFRAIVGTQLGRAMSGMKLCTIIFCAGKGRKEWLHLLNRLAEWARSEGCVKLRGLMRRGWAKDLPDFKLIANTMEKEL